MFSTGVAHRLWIVANTHAQHSYPIEWLHVKRSRSQRVDPRLWITSAVSFCGSRRLLTERPGMTLLGSAARTPVGQIPSGSISRVCNTRSSRRSSCESRWRVSRRGGRGPAEVDAGLAGCMWTAGFVLARVVCPWRYSTTRLASKASCINSALRSLSSPFASPSPRAAPRWAHLQAAGETRLGRRAALNSQPRSILLTAFRPATHRSSRLACPAARRCRPAPDLHLVPVATLCLMATTLPPRDARVLTVAPTSRRAGC